MHPCRPAAQVHWCRASRCSNSTASKCSRPRARPAVDRRRQGLGDLGFGAEVKDALRQRADFLIEQGLAEHRGQRVVLARNLLATLRGRELANAAQEIATETGLEHRPVADGNT